MRVGIATDDGGVGVKENLRGWLCAESFRDQSHLDAMVSETQDIENNALNMPEGRA